MLRTLTAAGAALAFAATAFSPGTAAAADDPPPGRVLIQVTTITGHGCPAGTVAVAVSPDNTAFTTVFGGLLAQVGAGSKPADSLKQCRIGLSVTPPRGYTYAVDRADYSGGVHLEKGASGTVLVSDYVEGTSYVPKKLAFFGPADEDWRLSDVPDPVAYAPCRPAAFTFSIALQVDAGTSDTSATTSFLALDSPDGNARIVHRLSLKRCPAA
ncbi:DUF4360 domain-containing protein [Streptomyces roseoverticillatus]|uniref:DUF4360 domain-containing protein n=1 Tax=Streptomyces roseoverticillatus TaxID=66429 RepID=UPI0033F80B25